MRFCRSFSIPGQTGYARVNIQPCTVLRISRSPPSSGNAGCGDPGVGAHVATQQSRERGGQQRTSRASSCLVTSSGFPSRAVGRRAGGVFNSRQLACPPRLCRLATRSRARGSRSRGRRRRATGGDARRNTARPASAARPPPSGPRGRRPPLRPRRCGPSLWLDGPVSVPIEEEAAWETRSLEVSLSLWWSRPSSLSSGVEGVVKSMSESKPRGTIGKSSAGRGAESD